MDLGMQMVKAIFTVIRYGIKLLIPLAKLLLRFLIFTGGWITVLLLFGLYNLLNKMNPSSIWYKFFNTGGWIITFLPMVYITVQNMVRLVTKDNTFHLFSVFSVGKNSPVVPAADRNLLIKEPSGFIFGKQKNSFVAKPEMMDGHILTVGGAGSGKSSCVGIPSLMSWKNSIFAIDIKGELYEKTKNKRKSIKVFNPSDENSCGYDPFYVLKSSDNLSADINAIAIAIIPLPPNIKDPYWIKSAQTFLTGALIYYYDNGCTFPEAIGLIQSYAPKTTVNAIANDENQIAKMYMNQFVELDEKTLGTIFSEISNKIMVFATDKTVISALNRPENITPDMLENGTDIYLCLEESRLEQWSTLLTMMINQFLKYFEKRNEQNATPILFLLDEFARLGKLESIINGLATLRSKKITIAMLTQSLAQIDMIYGKDSRKVIADNCQYKAILSATDAETQEYFSKLVGTCDKSKKSNSYNSDAFGIGKGTGTNTTTEEKRRIKPEDFATLKDIVLLTPYGFSRVQKTPYYATKEFQ